MTTLRVKQLNSVWGKATGLLGHDKAEPIFLKTRFGIHTFGMKYPIDVLILDRNNRLVTSSQGLKPNKLFFWPLIYDKVVELPEGSIRELNIKPRDRFKLEITR